MRSWITFLWGLFCANSWTWCIGMYLPVIMIKRFGWAGFLAFAIPNVAGCAAMGYIVRIRQRSESIISKHATAMTWFSIVTIAYHMFFLVWMFAELVRLPGEMYWAPLAIAGTVFAAAAVLSFLPNRDWLWLSVLVYGVSLTALAFAARSDLLIRMPSADEASDWIWVAPTLCFGFLLSPYLDLTFHRALQHSPSRHAFGLFGLAFSLMIVLTVPIWFIRGGMVLPIAIAHVLAQSVFTLGAHLREVRLSPSPMVRNAAGRHAAMFAPLLAAPLLYIARMMSPEPDLAENLYLRFLVFYGLIFPAYVLLLMMAARPEHDSMRRRILFAVLVIASLPLYELGFIHGRMWMLPVPLLALLATAAWLRWRRGLSDNALHQTG